MYLQVDLGATRTVCSVATQGTSVPMQAWVKSFNIKYSMDELFWHDVKEGDDLKVCSLDKGPVLETLAILIFFYL